MTEKLHIKCVVLGEANVGKTSIINRYFYNKLCSYMIIVLPELDNMLFILL